MLLVTNRWPMCSEMTTNAAGMMIRIEAQSNTGKTGFGTAKTTRCSAREVQRPGNPDVDDRRQRVAGDHAHQHRKRGEKAAEHQRADDDHP